MGTNVLTIRGMRFLNTLREAVQRWLGITTLISLIQTREKHDRERHAEQMAVLNEIKKRLTVEHINPSKQFTPPVLDWDAVQAIQLQILKDEEKNNGTAF